VSFLFFQEGAQIVATATEQSIPVQVRTKSEQARQFRDHARQKRRDHDAAVAEREAAHTRLVDNGVGPVDSAEVLKLQQSRWSVLQQNEAALNGLVHELTELKDHLDSEHKLCVALIDDYRTDEIRKLVEDFGVRESDARPRIDNSEPLSQLKREAFRITELSADLARMLKAANEEIEAITAKKSQLSKSWRAF
jgi:hypothetical protein